MSDRDRSRSRSPEPRTAQSDAPADNHANDNGGGDGADEVKLYIGNLDYGKYLALIRTLREDTMPLTF